eukprot:TRINITY_DN23442_c0_g1_i1.p1 TRINITY_DN23442_c0_g1~~TRINITY_DN23442_c0_g1_i1.p1  ORF type:complete len:618 (+),score=195.96 TRINITY_DN23442_c0_g1_i1:65-1918(+)
MMAAFPMPLKLSECVPPQDAAAAFLSRVPRPFLNHRAPAVAENIEVSTADRAVAEEETAAEKLPPVVSVKKSSKGCAVVLLRDPAVIERCAIQQVAVIDGVCVEMKKHSKKNRYDEDAPPEAGIFCAWGHRVERKMPISEEGIAEFFNSLGGQQMPVGLVATPPFAEEHLRFPIKSSSPQMMSIDVGVDVASKERLLACKYCPAEKIQALWHAKGRVDELWKRPPPPMARSVISRVARAQLFPHSGVGGEHHENRAGDKLAELSEVVGLLDGVPPGAAFLDLCGGPGAWSQHLLEKTELQLRGFGFTLRAATGDLEDWKADAKDEWYADLYEHPSWKALWGADDTGDLLKPGNLEHAARQLAREQVLLVVADGGFSDESIPPNQLELYFYRLFLAEVLMAAACLQRGGKFVCKLYTTFSAATAGLLYLTTRLFDSVSIVKPMSSRATGPERYLSASGFKADAETATIIATLMRSHELGKGASPLVTPLLTPTIDAYLLAGDEAFAASMGSMVSAMCERQTKALNAVVDRADFLEGVAMRSATCTDPFARRQLARREEEEREARHAERRAERERNEAAGIGKGIGKGNGKGDGKGKGNGKGKGKHDNRWSSNAFRGYQ